MYITSCKENVYLFPPSFTGPFYDVPRVCTYQGPQIDLYIILKISSLIFFFI